MHRYARIVEELLELVSIEQYGVGGLLSGNRLLVSAFREGALNLYSYDGRSLVRLNRDPVTGFAEPPYGSGRIILYRDVARGRELHKLYVVDAERPGAEKELHPDQKPSRILGVADDGRTVAFTAVHEKGIGVYAVRSGRLWNAANAPGLAMVSSVRGDTVAGVGVFPPEVRFFKPFTVNLSTGVFKVHEPPVKGNTLAVRILSDGTVVYGVEAAREARLFTLDPDTGRSSPSDLDEKVRRLNATSFNYIGETGKGELIVVVRRRGRSRVLVGDDELNVPEGIHGRAVEWGKEVAVTHASHSTPSRIVAAERGGRWRVVLEARKPWWLREVLGGFGYAEPRSSDGSPVPTIYRVSGRAPRPGPTVVLVHGGPFAEDTDTWDIFAVALQAAGFHVVQPNYRGSIGYGVEWTEKIIGDPCGAELEDVIAAARWARESGLASRLYVMGYSYGGYMTLCAMTRKPNVFDGGVAGASVADWEEMYELSDPAFKQFIEMLFAGRRDLWKERNPITYLENMKKPLALIHPTNDTRTPLKPVLRFLEKAAEAGKSVEAHLAPDMGHVVNTVDDVVKILLPAVLYLLRLEESAERAGKT